MVDVLTIWAKPYLIFSNLLRVGINPPEQEYIREYSCCDNYQTSPFIVFMGFPIFLKDGNNIPAILFKNLSYLKRLYYFHYSSRSFCSELNA